MLLNSYGKEETKEIMVKGFLFLLFKFWSLDSFYFLPIEDISLISNSVNKRWPILGIKSIYFDKVLDSTGSACNVYSVLCEENRLYWE